MIATLTPLGVMDSVPSSPIPVGIMVIACAMNAVAPDRFRFEVESLTGQMEAALVLGAEPRRTVTPHSRAAVQASLVTAQGQFSLAHADHLMVQ